MIFASQLFYTSVSLLVLISEDAMAYKSGCSGGYCFVVSEDKVGEAATQQEAERWCLSNKSQLVEIINKDIQISLVNFIQTQGLTGGPFFTNGRRSFGNWIRMSGANIGNINVHEQLSDGSRAYGYLRSTTTTGFDVYASKPIDYRQGFICSGVTDCTHGILIGGRCYKVYFGPSTWYDARNRCLDSGGDLASFNFIRTNAGFNALNGSWIRSTEYGYWIGFSREWWTWPNTPEYVSYSYWSTDEPTNQFDCLCLRLQSLWTGCDCNQEYQFVCFSGNESQTTVDTSTTSITPSVAASEEPSTSKTTMWSFESQIGIAVGAGCLLIIVIVVVILIIKRKRDPSKKDERNINTPDLVTNQGTGVVPCHDEATVYATVLKTSESDENNSHSKGFENNDKSQLVYVDLQILNS